MMATTRQPRAGSTDQFLTTPGTLAGGRFNKPSVAEFSPRQVRNGSINPLESTTGSLSGRAPKPPEFSNISHSHDGSMSREITPSVASKGFKFDNTELRRGSDEKKQKEVEKS